MINEFYYELTMMNAGIYVSKGK